jgi:hypothetical protein
VNVNIVWHGTQQEATELANSLAHNCSCEFGGDGQCQSLCGAHKLLQDQQIVDRLLFARYVANRLSAEEFRT